MDSSLQRIVAYPDPLGVEALGSEGPGSAGERLAKLRLDGPFTGPDFDSIVFPPVPGPGGAALAGGASEPGAVHVEFVEAAALVGYQTAWADLCTRALEPNVFLEPGFALPLLQHVRYPKRPSFLLVWEESGQASFGRLLGLFPLELHTGKVGYDGIARGFAHKQTSCGTPLVDRDRGLDALDALVTWLGGPRQTPIAALVFSGVAKDGPFHAEMRRFAALSARRLVGLCEHQRAVLNRSDEEAAPSRGSGKRRKERLRQFRRLSEVGTRTYSSARTPAEIARATERFLALEHNGWKGARGTALLADPTLATFTRTMTRLMVHEDKCRIDAVEIDGRPVAMGIILTIGDRAYYWKTAFDETYAPLSPGVQFTIELTRVQLADPNVVSTDSCAVADHPMIDRLWPARTTVTDMILAVAPGDSTPFARSLRIERLRRAGRQWIKAIWIALLRLADD